VETGLAGKRVLVTGASGGIGSPARAVHGRGLRGRRALPPRRDRAEALGADARSRADLRVEARSSGCSSGRPLDVCAAVAGIWPAEDVPVWELPLERWEETLRANLTATFLRRAGSSAGGTAGTGRW
jgi:3-oxoacyl-[acyl-carrier protein] reductase